MSYDNPWLYNGQIFESDAIGDNYGFVYCITDIKNNKKYIGKKFFLSSKTKQVKGKKKRYKAESDWKSYYGSSDEVKQMIADNGKDNFKREILHLCVSKGVCNYMELREQVLRDVLLKPEEYYNAFVGGKIHRAHIKPLVDIKPE